MILFDRHVALVGMMGCGKSTIGALVAKRLKIRFVDLDALIIERYGPINEIFANEGEAGFRACEYKTLYEVLAWPPLMISTGGGVLTHEPSRVALANTLVIYLEVSVKGLTHRLRRSSTVRPLVGAKPTEASIAALFEARRHFYESAMHRVNAEREVGAVVSSVLRLVKK